MSHAITLFQHPFYFLRHGETELNVNRLVAGSIDTALTALGHRQAAEAAAVFAHHPITGIYSSPLRRARDTAEPIAARLNLPVIVLALIGERNWGALEGQPRGSRIRGVTPQGAETTEEFAERVLAGFALIDAAVPLIVGHSGVFRVICSALEIVETEAPIANAQPLRFEPLAEGGWRLQSLDAVGGSRGARWGLRKPQ